MKTYLCGGINGLTDGECNDWRGQAKSLLRTDVLDPMARDYRGVEDSNVQAIVLGDLDDIRRSDFVLVNATRASWGTAMELVYAHQRGSAAAPGVGGKPIIAFVGRGARVSPWLRYHCTAIHETLYDACQDINQRLR